MGVGAPGGGLGTAGEWQSCGHREQQAKGNRHKLRGLDTGLGCRWHKNGPMTPTLDILHAIAARADRHHLVDLTPAEQEFALTLEGRRLLERIQLGFPEYRLSATALALLAQQPSSS